VKRCRFSGNFLFFLFISADLGEKCKQVVRVKDKSENKNKIKAFKLSLEQGFVFHICRGKGLASDSSLFWTSGISLKKMLLICVADQLSCFLSNQYAST